MVAYLTKQGCYTFGLGDSFYCHSDYAPIYAGRDLAGGRFPYGPPALEYPAGLGLLLWLAAAATPSALAFVQLNMLAATMACLGAVYLLWRLVGNRAWWFAAAPTVALYAFLNWDLVALVCAVAALAAFARRRDPAAGAWLGLGAAIKAFPALLLLPLLAERVREGDRRAATRILLAAAIPLIVLNAPVAWVSFEGWSHFLHFNSVRPVDWGTLWSAGCHTLGTDLCGNVPLVNMLASGAFLAGSAAAWFLITRAAPEIPRWQLGFPLLVIFFLTNKVFSPQYSLWILPWFPLVLPNLGLFLVYEVIDVGIYVTSFGWQERLAGAGGLPLWPLNTFIVLRAIVLVAMLVAFARTASKRTYRPGAK
jgi:hypothetical protein